MFAPRASQRLPVHAQPLTASAREVDIILQKTAMAAPATERSLQLILNGTIAERGEHMWNASLIDEDAGAGTPNWLSILDARGQLTRDEPSAALRLVARSSQLREGTKPYQATVRVDVQTSGQAFPLEIVRVEIPVSLFVSADASAQHCHVDGRRRPATVGKPTSFEFTSRDVDGLLLDHAAHGFSANVTRNGRRVELVVSLRYSGGGNWTARFTPPYLGSYAVLLSLHGVGFGDPASFLATCESPLVPGYGGDNCVCDAGAEPADTGPAPCRPCAPSFFKPLVGDAPCLECGANLVTAAEGARSADDCLCRGGFFGVSSGDGKGLSCRPCPLGGNCTSPGQLLASLTLRRGYWRVGTTSATVYRCDSPSACLGGPPSGPDGRPECASGSTGVLCADCEPGYFKLKPPLGGCQRCDHTSLVRSVALVSTVLVVIALVGAGIMLRRRRKLKARLTESSVEAIDSVAADAKELPGKAASATPSAESKAAVGSTAMAPTRHAKIKAKAMALKELFGKKLKSKFKTLVGTLQMLSLLGLCFEVDWPEEYDDVVSEVAVATNFNPIGPISVSCLIEWSWYDTLLLTTLAPICVIAALVLARRCLLRCSSPQRQRTADTLDSVANALVFLVFPNCTTAAFQTFSCRVLDAGADRPPLRVHSLDYSIDCEARRHVSFQVYAVAMIFVWPVGVPLYILLRFHANREGLSLLIRAQQCREHAAALEQVCERKDGPPGESGSTNRAERLPNELEANNERKANELERRGLAALRHRAWVEGRTQEYEIRAFAYDAIEFTRKSLLVGLTVLVERGTVTQLVLGMIIAALMLAINFRVAPYKLPTDDAFATLGQLVVFLNLAIAILLRSSYDVHRAELKALSDAGDLEGWFAAREGFDDTKRTMGYALLALCALLPICFVAFSLHDLSGLGGGGRQAALARQARGCDASLDPSTLPMDGHDPTMGAAEAASALPVPKSSAAPRRRRRSTSAEPSQPLPSSPLTPPRPRPEQLMDELEEASAETSRHRRRVKKRSSSTSQPSTHPSGQLQDSPRRKRRAKKVDEGET